MRFAPLFALTSVLLAAAPRAQPCVPDPIPAADYYPLGVGDEWIYHAPAFGGSAEAYVQRRVLREEEANGRLYAVDQTCSVAVEGGARTCEPERLVRIAGGSVLVRSETGGEGFLFEGLDAPFGSNPLGTCAYDMGTGPVVVGGIGYTVARVKGLPALDFGPPPFAAGVGPLGLVLGNLAERTDRFEYARVGGVEYGARPAGVGTPDPTPPADYYPLEAGNEWIYRYSEQSVLGTFDALERGRVLREETIGGLTYGVEQTCRYNLLVALPMWACGGERLVRVNAHTDLVVRSGSGQEYILRCQIGADVGAVRTCGPNGVTQAPWIDGGTTVEIGGLPYTVARIKEEGTLANVPPSSLIAGIGESEQPVGPFQQSRFEYARVRGVEYGVRPAEAGMPDPTPAEAYAPLAVGNRWEYRLRDFNSNATRGYRRETVVRDTLADGETWQVLRRETFAADRVRTSDAERLARFDAAEANVLERGLSPETAFSRYPCRLDLDLTGNGSDLCSTGVMYNKRSGTVLGVETTRLTFGYDFGSTVVAAGFGFLSQLDEGVLTELVFARIGGETFGTSVAGEADAAPTATFALAVAPNPTTGAFSLALALPEAQTVTVEAFDALGRRVWQQSAALGAGPQSVAVDARAWAPGVYVVRATAGQSAVTTRVVRR